MIDINKLPEDEILDFFYESNKIENFHLTNIIKDIYNKDLYKNIDVKKLNPKNIDNLLMTFNTNYLDFSHKTQLHSFLENLIEYTLNNYLKLAKLDSVFERNILDSIILLNIPIKNKVKFWIKLFWKDFNYNFVKYLIENVDDWNDILEYIENFWKDYIISLFENIGFNLPDDRIHRLKDKYIFLYSLYREEKLFTEEKNKDFLNFIILEQINFNKVIDFIFSNWIEIEKDTILPILKICFNSNNFIYTNKILDSVSLDILTSKIDEICDLILDYLNKPESISLNKKNIKIFLNDLITLLLNNQKYKSAIKIILKIYNNNIKLGSEDLYIFDKPLLLKLLSSKKITDLKVTDFEKIILFFIHFKLINCYELVDIRFKWFYNRFVIYRTLKKMFKNKVSCNYGYNFLWTLRKNYKPFSSSIIFYFIYWLYLKLFKKKI